MSAKAKLAEHVSRETLDSLEIYVDLLLKWTRKINLISASTAEDIWLRHILDSAQFACAAPARFTSWADLGSGAGLPGLVVAACIRETHPDASVTLIEKDTRKAMFLHEASREMSVPVQIIQHRIKPEGRGDFGFGTFDVVSARALACLDELLGLAAPLISSKGTCLFAKGYRVDNEIDIARRRWNMLISRIPSVTNHGSVLLRIEELEHA